MINMFYDNPYQKEVQTTIQSSFEEEGQFYVKVNENIFYPHGGGQKGDRGTLYIGVESFDVINTVKDPYSTSDVMLVTPTLIPENATGSPVICKLDWSFRYTQMKLHTAAHLHHCMLERALQKSIAPPKTSDIQDGFAFNRYEKLPEINQEAVEKANELFRQSVAKGAKVTTYPDETKEGFRWWKCLEYKIPCGGTHVANIHELGEVTVTFSTKKGNLTVNIST